LSQESFAVALHLFLAIRSCFCIGFSKLLIFKQQMSSCLLPCFQPFPLAAFHCFPDEVSVPGAQPADSLNLLKAFKVHHLYSVAFIVSTTLRE